MLYIRGDYVHTCTTHTHTAKHADAHKPTQLKACWSKHLLCKYGLRPNKPRLFLSGWGETYNGSIHRALLQGAAGPFLGPGMGQTELRVGLFADRTDRFHPVLASWGRGTRARIQKLALGPCRRLDLGLFISWGTPTAEECVSTFHR